MDLTKEIIIANSLATMAAEKIMEVYQSPDMKVTLKDNYSPLTMADQTANDIIVEGLQRQFPAHAILAEESKDDPARLEYPWCWIVDPLDGTKEFVQRIPEFTVNIALSYRNRVVLGVICVPVTGELYWASQGEGAFYQKSFQEPRETLRVSERTADIRMVMSRSHASEQLQELIDRHQIRNLTASGSSLKGCMVARGEAEVYYRFNPTMEWDTAAMQCIVEQSGGIMRQMDDSELLYNRENSLNDKGFYILNSLKNKLH